MLGLERKAERAARKGAAFTAASALVSVGLGFLTLAAWMVLTELQTPEFAAIVIGAAYVGAALLVFALGLKKPDRHTRSGAVPEDMSALQMIILSFVQGFEQGRQNTRSP